MNRLVDVAISRARMIVAFIILSLVAGWMSYTGLPKEGSPNIDIPTIYVSVGYPGVSALDAERLLVKPLEAQLKTLEGLKEMTGVATEGHASVALEFDFGFDKDAILAEVRAEVDKAQAEFPDDANEPRIIEINTSEFPILNVTLSGDAPERTLVRVANELQDAIEGIPSVLEAEINGKREELVEIVIDPSRLESYGITASELLQTVSNNNQVIAAGAVETQQGSFSIKLPGAIETLKDIYELPIKVQGERVVTMRDLADVRRTFEDRTSIARFNGEPTISLSIKQRTGENIISTVEQVRAVVGAAMDAAPDGLRDSVQVNFSLDQAKSVEDMVSQLESSVITAVVLVMIVIVAALGIRSAILVAFAIPTSFLLAFALLAVLGMTVNNMVMFGLILAVGMLVDGAIVVTEYADTRQAQGARPSEAYGEAARRMFWPIVASTATTLCAFLPMLFWPGMPGQFMRYLPITLIFVLSASLLVALIYLPITGILVARTTRAFSRASDFIRAQLGWVGAMVLGGAFVLGALTLIDLGQGMALVDPSPVPDAVGDDAKTPVNRGAQAMFALAAVCAFLAILAFVAGFQRRTIPIAPYRPTTGRLGIFGTFMKLIVGNPVMPLVVIGLTGAALFTIFQTYKENNYGVEFFVETDPEVANLYVSARGNLSIGEKDAIMRVVESRVLGTEDVSAALAIVGGDGGNGADQGSAPKDSIGRIQFEFDNWRVRKRGAIILEDLREAVAGLPGVKLELAEQQDGPQQGKPVQVRVAALDFDKLQAATKTVMAHMEGIEGLKDVSSTLPLPGIEWELVIDRTEAGRYGASVASIGSMVQLVTRGVTVGTYRPDDSDDEIDIRGRFPAEDRDFDILDQLRVQTNVGLVPLGNFVERRAVAKVSEITRVDGVRVFTIAADVEDGTNANEKIAEIGEWLLTADLGKGVKTTFVGDFEEQQESGAFLIAAFAGALGLMFIILLAQFDSIYNSILVLLAVVLSVGGVLVGMMVMGQSFSIIMTGIGIVALAGIVVNNNIVLIDTYQEFRQTLPDIEAIIQTGVQRLRPVILTTITTMAGLLPMMFAVSIDFREGGIVVGAPSAMMWTQLATAIVFGLGFATVLTLVVTPSLLALRIWWLGKLPRLGWRGLRTLAMAGAGQTLEYNRDRRLTRKVRQGFRGGHTVRWDETVAFGAEPESLPAPAFPDIQVRGHSDTPPRMIPERGMISLEPALPATAAAVGLAPVLGGAEEDGPDLSFMRADMTPTLVWSEGMPLPPDDPGDDKPPFTQAAE